MNVTKSPLIYLERAAVGFLLFSATGVTVFARSSMTWESLLMPVLTGALALLITFRYDIRVSFRLIVFFAAYLVLFLLQWLIYGSFHPKHMVLYPFNFWVAYCLVRAMRERLLLHLEFLVTRLSATSLAIWLADVVTSGAVRRLLNGISIGQPYNDIVESYIVIQTFINETVDSVLPRNSGFAWEPGAFAVFCCAALMVNFYRTRFAFRRNFGAIVLVAAILSSQSTTGYSILIAFLLIKMWRDTPSATRFVLFPAMAITVVVSLYSLPFMERKVNELLSEDLSQLAWNATRPWNAGHPIAAQRFLSFQLDYSDFLNNPWTGYGGRDSEMIVNREGLNIVSISGVGKVMARFGILGISFFFLTMVLSSRLLSRQFCVGNTALLTVFIILTSISYSLIEHPLFISIWAYSFMGCFGGKYPSRIEGNVTRLRRVRAP